MVKHRAWLAGLVGSGESPLRRSPDFAILGGDVVQPGESHVKTKTTQGLDQPPIAQPV